MANTLKRIFVLIGHPDPNSFTASLAKAYVKGATSKGHDVRVQSLGEMHFDPILHNGYNRKQELEEDLSRSQENILWCNHWVIVHPLWWGSAPALLKGYFDRILLPGFGFKYEKGKALPKRLLSNRSARVMLASDTPTWWLKLVYGGGWLKIMKRQILKFCGFNSVKFNNFSIIKGSSETYREKLLKDSYKVGKNE